MRVVHGAKLRRNKLGVVAGVLVVDAHRGSGGGAVDDLFNGVSVADDIVLFEGVDEHEFTIVVLGIHRLEQLIAVAADAHGREVIKDNAHTLRDAVHLDSVAEVTDDAVAQCHHVSFCVSTGTVAGLDGTGHRVVKPHNATGYLLDLVEHRAVDDH